MTAKPEQTWRNFKPQADAVLAEIVRRHRPRDPALARKGYFRGIDYYGTGNLVPVIARIFSDYHRLAGHLPELLRPRLYSEKVLAFMLMGWMKVPQSGNKLTTASFLSPESRGLVGIPEVVWMSRSAALPRNDELPPGEYYFKANHGSGWSRRIRYPLTGEARAELEALAGKWLSTTFGLLNGQWWYNVFPRAVFIERCVTRRNPSAALLFYVFHGRVQIISIDEKLLDGTRRTRSTVCDGTFRQLEQQTSGIGRVAGFDLDEHTKAMAIAAAEIIGRGHEAVRVDLIPGDDGELYLNEITFSSGAGMPLSTGERDEAMGRMWTPCALAGPD